MVQVLSHLHLPNLVPASKAALSTEACPSLPRLFKPTILSLWVLCRLKRFKQQNQHKLLGAVSPYIFLVQCPRGVRGPFSPVLLFFSCEVWRRRASVTQNTSLAVTCNTTCPRTVQRLPLSRQWRWWDNLWERKQDIFWPELGKEGGGRGGTLQLLPSISVNWKGLSPDSC